MNRRINAYYPDAGPLRRELYPKHVDYFAAGSGHRERLMLAANRVGKTEGVGGYELTLHLTGLYPHWWTGRRFDRPIKAWASGDTGKTTRDILQEKLLGPLSNLGSGLIPAECIEGEPLAKPGVPGAKELVNVRHVSGGCSLLVFKSYDQRREAFQGTEQDVIWLDEEPPLDIYTECLMRTMTNNGMVMCTFTPLMGMSETVMQFLPGGKLPEPTIAGQPARRFVVMATWDDAPHLNDQVKKELWESIPPYQRDARSKGIPQLGSGAIYPVPESEITVPDFPIPEHWPRCYGLDVGWNWTAAVWLAEDRETKTAYIYRVYKRSQAEPSVHATAIKAPGDWINGVIDPASRGRSQRDGHQLIQDYKDLGLKLDSAVNTVEAGLYQVWERLSAGKLKIFASCAPLFDEYRLYRRDDKGRVVKDNDHLMDAMRYAVVSGLDVAKVKPSDKPKRAPAYASSGGLGWMG